MFRRKSDPISPSESIDDIIARLWFIHIAKCGGTYLNALWKANNWPKKNMHRRAAVHKKGRQYIIWIRNPISRFVSAFNMSQAVINTDFTQYESIKDINIENHLLPARARKFYIEQRGFFYTEEYEGLINFFGSPNVLAESLSSSDRSIRSKAVRLMKSSKGHISNGLGFCLKNGKFIEKQKKDIFFVGKLETMSTDIERLEKKLGVVFALPSFQARENTDERCSKYLSKKAIKNIINFHKHTDYKTLHVLKKQGWIDEKVLRSYYQYEN